LISKTIKIFYDQISYVYGCFVVLDYPLSLDNNWFDIVLDELTEIESNWLFETSSLTARLKLNSRYFEVKVLSEIIQDLTMSQANILKTDIQTALFREVVLYCDGKPQVYAQSWIPLRTQQKQNNELMSLGTKPLGEQIFKDPSIKRNTIEIAKFDSAHPIANVVNMLGLAPLNCWGRRSVLTLAQQKLLVCEIFLPGSFIETKASELNLD
jgi:chorismate--pyruvate lyase